MKNSKKQFLLFLFLVFVFGLLGASELVSRDYYTFTGAPFSLCGALLDVTSGMVFAILVASAVFLVGRYARYILVPMLLFAAINTIVEVYALVHFRRRLGGGWYSLVVTSSWQELANFFAQQIGMCEILLVFCAVFIMALLAREIWKANIHFEKGTAFCGVVVVVLAIGAIFVTTIFAKIPPPSYVGLIPSTYQSITAFNRIRYLLNASEPQHVETVVNKDSLPFCVIVVGESACRSHMGVYGYKRPTTPQMSSMGKELIVYENVQTIYPYTEESLKALFVHESNKYTFASICHAAGYDCKLVSAQGRFKSLDVGDSLIFKGVSDSVYLADRNVTSLVYDDEIVSVVAEFAKESANTPMVVFAHLYGSHFPFASRYPAMWKKFPEGGASGVVKMVDDYDNSLLFTDYVIGKIVEILRTIDRPTFLCYISDHGESPDVGKTRFLGDKNCWEVPLIFWVSNGFKEVFPEKVKALDEYKNRPLQNDWLMGGMLDLLSIKWDNMSVENNFLSPLFDNTRKRVVEF